LKNKAFRGFLCLKPEMVQSPKAFQNL
jgi:hypothetical protein